MSRETGKREQLFSTQVISKTSRDFHSNKQYLFRNREYPLEYPLITYLSYNHPQSDFKKFRSMKGFAASHMCGSLPHSCLASPF